MKFTDTELCKSGIQCEVCRSKYAEGEAFRNKYGNQFNEDLTVCPRDKPMGYVDQERREYEKAAAQKTPAYADRFSCKYRSGEPISVDTCAGCGGRNIPVDIYGCDKHGSCSVTRVAVGGGAGKRPVVCSTCRDRHPVTQRTDPPMNNLPQLPPGYTMPEGFARRLEPGDRVVIEEAKVTATGLADLKQLHDGYVYDADALGPIKTTNCILSTEGEPVRLDGLYQGRSAFLVLAGPSVKEIDLDPLGAPGVLSMGVNNSPANNHKGVKKHRPQLWCCGDAASRFVRSIWEDPTILKFLPADRKTNTIFDSREWKYVKRNAEQCPGVMLYRRANTFDPQTYLTDPAAIQWGREGHGFSVMLVALRLLFVLGVRTVYLVGADFSMSTDNTYAFEEGRGPGAVSNNKTLFGKLNRFFDQVRPIFEHYGFNVFNCNPDSGLHSFNHVSYEDALNSVSDEFGNIDVETEPTRGMYEAAKQADFMIDVSQAPDPALAAYALGDAAYGHDTDDKLDDDRGYIIGAPPIVAGFYTRDTPYEDEARQMVESAQLFGLEFALRGFDSLGNWDANTHIKPTFLRDLLREKAPRSLLYVDADGRFRQKPRALYGATCDIAVHYRVGRDELLSGTIFLNPTDATFELLDRWIELCDTQPRIWDQRLLDIAIKSMDDKIDVMKLPASYTLIYDLMRDQGPPVIEHFQASRRFKKVVNA